MTRAPDDFVQPALGAIDPLARLVGRSRVMEQLKADIRKVAGLNVPVLLLGESGTGKELAARALHDLSARRDRAYVALNAAAIPSGLVESEFFGHEPGAFTGADRRGRRGKFEAADSGTLFLDEVGDMPVDIQAKLLRVLEDGRFERLGGSRCVQADFRLVCASHRDFAELIRREKFRHDLYYRISAVTLRMPALRERLEDLGDLVSGFLGCFAQRHRMPLLGMDPAILEYLGSRLWPGNVRQLRHDVERAAIFAEGGRIVVDDFRRCTGGAALTEAISRQAGASTTTVRARTGEVEFAMIREAMTEYNGNKKRVAQALGISRSHLYKRLAQAYGDAANRAAATH